MTKNISLKSLLCLGVILLSPLPVSAAVITETWKSTIRLQWNSAFNIDETFNWTVTYDTNAHRIHEYGDGANQIAEGGDGDDYVATTRCSYTADPAGCTIFDETGPYDFYSDAVFDLTELYAIMYSDGFIEGNLLAANQASVTQRSGQQSRGYFYQRDFIYFNPNTVEFYDFNQEYSFLSLTSVMQPADHSDIPEPAILALFLAGLLGIGTIRRTRPAP
ncbi:PEP-CTERM sorting domain-containing protein [Pseudomonadota bacterium]